MNKEYSIAIHGGAGTILRSLMDESKESAYSQGLEDALNGGLRVLASGGKSIDAVEIAVRILEDNPLFNAGRGSVYNAQGGHEMDAAIMCGIDRSAGAVASVPNVKNPISLARAVMEKTNHVLLCHSGALEFAQEIGLEIMDEQYFHDDYRLAQWKSVKDSGDTILDHSPTFPKKFGTVGAVAKDKTGNLAAATSTGGMTNKKFMRIGDSPLIGSGTFADNRTCAVSCTGNGEDFIRGVIAYDLSCLMEFKGLSLQQAADQVVFERLEALKGEGGLIAVDAHGEICMPFNSDGMYRAMADSTGNRQIGIYKEETS